LAFNAPYVIDRLVKDRVVDTPALAEQLFTEAKRYLVLCAATPDALYGMSSAMVDEAWHTFVLFTSEYTEYGDRYFGRYVHHKPAGDQGATGVQMPNTASFNDFRLRYEELYGHPLPEVWYDDGCLAPSSRVINDMAGKLTLVVGDDVVELTDDSGQTLLTVNELACEALSFIAENGAFYVRELPGDLTGYEQVGVVAPLVRSGVLRLAP
jgi:hypothetical protein